MPEAYAGEPLFSAGTKSARLAIDNTAGTTDLVQPLAQKGTRAIAFQVRYPRTGGKATIWLGDASAQNIELRPGSIYMLAGIVKDLGDMYVRVPPGEKVELELLWEAET